MPEFQETRGSMSDVMNCISKNGMPSGMPMGIAWVQRILMPNLGRSSSSDELAPKEKKQRSSHNQGEGESSEQVNVLA